LNIFSNLNNLGQALAAVVAPPDIISQLFVVLLTMLLFELARCLRRYVVIKNGQFNKVGDLPK